MASFVVFPALLLSAFSYLIFINFSYIANFSDATSATLFITTLLAITLVVTFTVALVVPRLLFSSGSNTRSARSQLEHKLEALAIDNHAPLTDIELSSSTRLPHEFVEIFNRFLARVRSRLETLHARIATNTRRHTELQAEQAKLDSEKMELVGEASLKLNSALTTLTAAIDAAINEIETQDTATRRSSLTAIYREAVRLSEDAKILLSFSTQDLTLPLSESEFNFNSLVQECINATGLSCNVSSNSIHSSHSGPLNIFADRMRLKMILENLLMHAHKVCGSGHVSVVSIVSEELLFLSIRDTGPDIADQDLKMVFNRQADRQPVARAVGPGLCICKTWVESLSGAIVVRSEQGKSTTFQITVPISNAA